MGSAASEGTFLSSDVKIINSFGNDRHRAPNCCFSLGLQNIKHQSWDGVGWGDEKQSNQHTVS